MVTKETVEQLLQFCGNGFYITSLYLNVDGRVLPRRQNVEQEWNNLNHQAGRKLDSLRDLSREQKKSLDKDLEAITEFINYEFVRNNARTLAIFSCSAQGFWQVYPLPVALKSEVFFNAEPQVRPLLLVLDEYERYAVVVVDRRKARIFTVYLGQIEEHTGVFEDDVPARVREGEWAGLREKKILGHIEDHFHRHLKSVANKTLSFFKQKNFDRLILAGHQEVVAKFEEVLHSYLRERIVDHFYVEPDTSLEQILRKSLEIEEEVEREEERELLDQLHRLAKPEGYAAIGLEATLEALMLGQIESLLIGAQYRTPGYTCPQDHFLSTYVRNCPVCNSTMEPEEDISNRIIEETVKRNGKIEYIFIDEEFSKEGIGALLRYAV